MYDLYRRNGLGTGATIKTYFTGSSLRLEKLRANGKLMEDVFGRNDQILYDVISSKASGHMFSILGEVTRKDLINILPFVKSGLKSNERYGKEVVDDEEGIQSVEATEEDVTETDTGRSNNIRENYKAIVQMIALFNHYMEIQTKASGDPHSIMKMFVLMAGLDREGDYGYQKLASEKWTLPRLYGELKKSNSTNLSNNDNADILIKSSINAALLHTIAKYKESTSLISRYYNDTSEVLNYNLFRDFNTLLKTLGIDIFKDENGRARHLTTRNYGSIIPNNFILRDDKFNIANISALADGGPEIWLDHISSKTIYKVSEDRPVGKPVLLEIREDLITSALQAIHELQCLECGTKEYGTQQIFYTQKILSSIIALNTEDLPYILSKLYNKITLYPELLQPNRGNHFRFTELDNDNPALAEFLDELIEKRFEEVTDTLLEKYRILGWNNKIEYQDRKALQLVMQRGPNEAGIESIAGSIQVFETKAIQDNEEVSIRFLITANRRIILAGTTSDDKVKLNMDVKEAEIDAQIVNGRLTITSDGL